MHENGLYNTRNDKQAQKLFLPVSTLTKSYYYTYDAITNKINKHLIPIIKFNY